jgi:hypothetical protein
MLPGSSKKKSAKNKLPAVLRQTIGLLGHDVIHYGMLYFAFHHCLIWPCGDRLMVLAEDKASSSKLKQQHGVE